MGEYGGLRKPYVQGIRLSVVFDPHNASLLNYEMLWKRKKFKLSNSGKVPFVQGQQRNVVCDTNAGDKNIGNADPRAFFIKI